MNHIEIRIKNTREFIELAEDAAIPKVMDIHKDLSLKRGFVRFDRKDPSRDRLKENLLYLVESFAQSNENFSPPRPVVNSFEATILMHHRLPQKIPREEVYTILIRNGKAQGLVILDIPPNGISYYNNSRRIILSKCVDFNSTTTQETVGITVQAMTSIYKEIPNYCVPVYGLSGWIYWPFEASYDQLKGYFAGDQDEI